MSMGGSINPAQQGQQTGLQHYGPRDDMTFGNR